MHTKNSAIILAAGKATRYGDAKQDIIFNGKALWKHVYDTTREVIKEKRIVVVGKTIQGGKTRSESVLRGLQALPQDTERVIILEAARPLVTKEQIMQLLENDAKSVSFAVPIISTVVYRAGGYLNRDELYELQAPQAFDYSLLLDAYTNGNFTDVTEETRVISDFFGIKPCLIETGKNLFKVTYPGDLAIIEALYLLQNKKDKK